MAKQSIDRRDFHKFTSAALGGLAAGAMLGCSKGGGGAGGDAAVAKGRRKAIPILMKAAAPARSSPKSAMDGRRHLDRASLFGFFGRHFSPLETAQITSPKPFRRFPSRFPRRKAGKWVDVWEAIV